MSLQGKTQEQIGQLEDAFLGKLRHRGSSAGNITMMRELEWEDDLYWEVRDRLLDQGKLTLGKGKGGSVHLVGPGEKDAVEETECAVEPEKIPSEEELYAPMSNVLGNRWAKDKRFQSHLAEITARAGRKKTGGMWTRPDITVLAMAVFPYVPGKHFDVITFEVKPYRGIDVSCVYEALAHRRAATRSYVLLHIPEECQGEEWVTSTLGEIEEEAKRHGLGVIVAGEPDNYESWDERVEAKRHEPTPERLNEFLAVQISPAAREQITTWFR